MTDSSDDILVHTVSSETDSVQNSVIDAVIGHSMFNKTVNVTDIDKNDLPNKTFGCFVTVVRSDLESATQNVSNSVSSRVHGCIGYWDSRYKELSKTKLFEHLMRVSVDAVHNDSRKEKFDSLYSDFDAEFEITYMMLPRFPMDKTTGLMVDHSSMEEIDDKEFNDDDFGIIVEELDETDNTVFTSRATFLPKVFHNKPWSYVSEQLAHKAGVDISSKNVQFYAYRGIVHKKLLANRFIYPYINFMNNAYTSSGKIPYSVSGPPMYSVSYDNSSHVRNTATISDLFDLINKKYNITSLVKSNMTKDARAMINKFRLSTNDEKRVMRQSYPFLLGCVQNLPEFSNDVLRIAMYLIDSLEDVKSTDVVFEYGEIISSLAETLFYVKDSTVLSKIKNVLREEIEIISNLAESIGSDSDDVFQLNWLSQSVRSIYDTNVFDDAVLIKTADTLLKKFSVIVPKFSLSSESNFLCVSFEGLSSIRRLLTKLTVTEVTECDVMIEKLLKLIHPMINDKGLVEFKTKDSRVDITGHFLSGIDKLRIKKNSMIKKGGSRKCRFECLSNLYIVNKESYFNIRDQV